MATVYHVLTVTKEGESGVLGSSVAPAPLSKAIRAVDGRAAGRAAAAAAAAGGGGGGGGAGGCGGAAAAAAAGLAAAAPFAVGVLSGLLGRCLRLVLLLAGFAGTSCVGTCTCTWHSCCG